MELEKSLREKKLPIDLDALGRLIATTQKESGEIPWHEGGKTDPWDMVEAAMGLTVAGYVREARRAYEWLAAAQREDGSWYAAYRDGEPEDRTRDANMTAYIAVGVYHYYLVTRDLSFLQDVEDRAGCPGIRSGLAGAGRRDPLGHQPDRGCRPRGALDRLELHLHEPEVRARRGRASGPQAARVAPRASAAWERHSYPAILLRHVQGALFDGLVLPGSERRGQR